MAAPVSNNPLLGPPPTVPSVNPGQCPNCSEFNKCSPGLCLNDKYCSRCESDTHAIQDCKVKRGDRPQRRQRTTKEWDTKKDQSSSVNRCFACREEGHMRKDCPKEKSKLTGKLCHNCNKPGHLIRNCRACRDCKRIHSGPCANKNKDRNSPDRRRVRSDSPAKAHIAAPTPTPPPPPTPTPITFQMPQHQAAVAAPGWPADPQASMHYVPYPPTAQNPYLWPSQYRPERDMSPRRGRRSKSKQKMV
jgi:hypothetical protein